MPLATVRRALVVALILPALASAADTARRVAVPDHGELEIALPAAWRASTEAPRSAGVDQDGKAVPPEGETLRMEPEQGTKFVLMTTPAWVPAEVRDAKVAATWMRTRLHNQTVEADVSIEEFKGSRNLVYWFKATNKSPLPGEHDRMVQGAAVVGELLVGFTMLYHPGDLPERDVVLKALGGARHIAPKQ